MTAKNELRKMEQGGPGLRLPQEWVRGASIRKHNAEWVFVVTGLSAEQAAEIQHQILSKGKA